MEFLANSIRDLFSELANAALALAQRIGAALWAWTREPERLWERMRARYAQGGYDGDRDTGGTGGTGYPALSGPGLPVEETSEEGGSSDGRD